MAAELKAGCKILVVGNDHTPFVRAIVRETILAGEPRLVQWMPVPRRQNGYDWAHFKVHYWISEEGTWWCRGWKGRAVAAFCAAVALERPE